MKTIFAWLISLMFLGSGFAYAGTYLDSAHGDSVSGVDRSAVTSVTAHPDAINEYAIGHCGHCHEMHASIGGVEPAPAGDTQNPYALFKENYGSFDRNQLCFACHNNLTVGTLGSGRYGIYQGYTKYEASSHDDSANFSWPDGSPPGPQSPDDGNCLNCHNPHGYDDGSLIPSQLFKREEDLCEACHDGSPASATKDIQAQINKASAHPTDDYSGRHSESEDMTPANFAYDAVTDKRHAECVDCHNPHVAKAGTHALETNAVSNVLLGISGVSVTNSTAWTAPTYSTINNETGITKEYQLCFKCHSSWTTQPSGQTNIALQFNTYNASYHSVEGAGKADPNKGTYVAPWDYLSLMYCSDCHGSETSSDPAGPHGSTIAKILKGAYTTDTGKTGINTSSHLCFICHDYQAYSADGTKTASSYSGFSNVDGNLHTGAKTHLGYPCMKCHSALPHGVNRVHLIVFDADSAPYNNGSQISSYTENTGSYTDKNCSTSGTGCHK